MNLRKSRRQFLQTSAAVAGGLALPYFVPRTAFGANDRIRTGHIGIGGQGMSNLKGRFFEHAVAVCDVDEKHLANAVKAFEDKGRKCATYHDYRKLLESPDIDAVVISTPDHWHALPTIDACRAGKDVYCEKPLSLTVAEGRKMVDAARATQRLVQTGSQQRSADNFRLACELVRGGKIGKVQQVLVGIPAVNFKGPAVDDSAPPPELDYNFWLGPAPERPYNEKRVHYLFRFFWDYSGGQMTNFGAHHIDIGQWGLGADDTGPVEISGTADYHPEKWYEVPMNCRVTLKYAGDITMTVGQGQKDIPGGTTFIGDKGQIFVTRGALRSTPSEIVDEAVREQKLDAKAGNKQMSPGHAANFLECIGSRKLPICDVEIGHRSATVCHLANMSLRLNRTLKWDPSTERIVGDSEAAAMLSRPYRAPWKI